MQIDRSIKFVCICEYPTGSLLISFPHLKIEWRAIYKADDAIAETASKASIQVHSRFLWDAAKIET